MFLIDFLPLIFFIFIYVGSGIFFSFMALDNAFYIISSIFVILPAISLAWFINNKRGGNSMKDFLEGSCHNDIISMCFIFILTGALVRLLFQLVV